MPSPRGPIATGMRWEATKPNVRHPRQRSFSNLKVARTNRTLPNCIVFEMFRCTCCIRLAANAPWSATASSDWCYGVTNNVRTVVTKRRRRSIWNSGDQLWRWGLSLARIPPPVAHASPPPPMIHRPPPPPPVAARSPPPPIVNRPPPAAMTYGVHRFDSVIGIFCTLRQESVGKILRPEAFTM